ncbi:MAG: ABC transporter permease [Bernardetiaceae bacterium]|nr:ABC transporter permease [Bernardetiaceae bacterium]
MNQDSKEEWTQVITPQHHFFDFRLREVWRYRDLILLFVRRNFVSLYKQTIFGHAWHFIVPLVQALMYAFVFGKVAQVSTEGAPLMAFYMTNVVAWGYFATCLNNTANTFTANAGIFGKVYFPRLVTPISAVLTALINFGIQFLILLCILTYYYVTTDLLPTMWILLLPILLLIEGGLALGLGILLSALTTKYRDLTVFLTFGVQFFMYITPVVYPVSQIESPTLVKLMYLNPMASIMESFRYALLGNGIHDPYWLLYSGGFALGLFLLGILVFNRVERTFMDTV